MMDNTIKDRSFYAEKLSRYLKENHFEEAIDTAFIRERAKKAEKTYTENRRNGDAVLIADEKANSVLMDNLYRSKYNIMTAVMEDNRMPAIIHNFTDLVKQSLINECLKITKDIFKDYPYKEKDFTESQDYDTLYTALTEKVKKYMTEHGIQ